MRILATIAAILILSACGASVEVAPAHVGKVLTKSGYAPETLTPSKFRLPPCFAYCDKLVVLQAADQSFKESMDVFMPEDDLKLTVEVRGTLSIPTNQKIIDTLFDRVTAVESDNSNIDIITAASVYKIYGQPSLRGIVRSEITKHSINQVLAQREAIGQTLHAAIQKKMEETNTPLIVSRFELAKVEPPEIIMNALMAAKEREIDIQKAEADAEVDLVKAERQLEVAKKDRLVEREKAEAIAEQNKIAAKSITQEVLAYKKLETALEIYKALAASDNVVIVPADSSSFHDITSDAVLSKLMGREVRK